MVRSSAVATSHKCPIMGASALFTYDDDDYNKCTEKKLQVLHALQMMGFHSLSKPTIASVMKLTQYKRIGHIPFIITTCIWKFIDWEIVSFFFSDFGCLGFNACKYCLEIWPVPLHTDSWGSWFCVEEMKQGDVSVSHTTEGKLNHMLIIKPWQMAFWCIKISTKRASLQITSSAWLRLYFIVNTHMSKCHPMLK